MEAPIGLRISEFGALSKMHNGPWLVLRADLSLPWLPMRMPLNLAQSLKLDLQSSSASPFLQIMCIIIFMIYPPMISHLAFFGRTRRRRKQFTVGFRNIRFHPRHLRLCRLLRRKSSIPRWPLVQIQTRASAPLVVGRGLTERPIQELSNA